MQFSFSRVETFKKCPYLYKLRYIDEVRALPNVDDASNALFLGTGLHEGIEKSVDEGIKAYFNQFPVINDLHLNEELKLRYLVPKVRAMLPQECTFEYKLECEDFIGYIDLLVYLGDNQFAIYDFKYSNNVDHYLASAQLHVYKHFFELLNEGAKVAYLGFIFVPKTAIRQKKTEDLYQFRKRILSTLEGLEIKCIEVKFDPEKVREYFNAVEAAKNATEFPKCESNLCRFCDYQHFCKEGITYMLLPKNERRAINPASRKKVWIYGAPFSGKTTLADHFPHPLMLNTDGNLNSFTAPVVEIKETYEGRIAISAWDNFKSAIDELAKGAEFETVVVDLVEDTYEHCRRWCYEKLGIEHESDNSFKAWDYVRNEFLSVFKKLMTLDYNIVLISHEDLTKDITKKTGDKITAIKPNINEKTANKLAGMVDIVARVVADGDVRTLNFKSDDVVFGGGRLKLTSTSIPCTYDALESVYQHQGEPAKREEPVKQEEEPVKTETLKQEEEPAKEGEPVKEAEPAKNEEAPVRRRGRRRRTEETV